MRKSRAACVLIFCLLMLALSVYAQPARWPFRLFNTSNGLPQNTVYDLVQDNKGWLWISTGNGITVFDGYQFHVIDTLPGKKELEREYTRFVKEKECIWIFQKKNIVRYDEATGKLQPIVTDFPSDYPLKPVYNDSAQIIFYSGETGYLFHKKSEKITAFAQKDVFNEIRTSDIDIHTLSVNQGYLVKGESHQDNFLCRIDFPSLTLSTIRAIPVKSNSVCKLDSSYLFLGMDNNLYFAKNQNASQVLVARTHNLKKTYTQLVQLKTNRNEYLVAAGTDLFVIKLSPEFSIHRVTKTDGSAMVQKGKILKLLKDASGNIWIASNAEGLIQVPASGNSFRFLHSDQPEDNFTRFITIDPYDKNIWAGLFFGSINVFDRNGFLQQEITHTAKQLLGKHNVINYIHHLNKNELLVFGERDKTYHINLAKKSITECIIIAGNQEKYLLNQKHMTSITSIQSLGNGRFLKVFQRLLFTLSYAHDTLFVTRIKNLPYGCENIYSSGPNEFWIPAKGKLIMIDSTGNIQDSLLIPSNRKAKCLVIGSDKKFWVGTERGIYVYKNKKLLHSLSQKDGIPNDFFYTMLPDDAGYIWGSTNLGLVRINMQSLQVRSFTVSDGLQGNEFNTGAAFKAKDGTLYFGGISGINSFRAANIKGPILRGRVNFTQVLSGYNRLIGPLQNSPGILSLPASSGNLTVYYSAFNFADPGANEYEYRLGTNLSWLTAGRNSLQLFLAPGKYELQVRLKSDPGSVATLGLDIAIPFYLSWWFRTLCILLFVTILGSLILLQTRDKYQREIAALTLHQKIQEEKERISRELHDDLGAKANLLSYNASLLSENPTTETTDLIGSRIKDAADDMLIALRETMWTLKQENIGTTETWVRFKNFISKMQRTYTGIHFNIEENITLEKTLAYHDALNLVRILQESLQNAIRHSKGSVVVCSVYNDGDKMFFSVKDNGTGFTNMQNRGDHIGNGIDNMRFRSKQSGFELTIQSDSNGTSIQVRI